MTGPRVAVLDHMVERGGAQIAIARLAEAMGRRAELTFIVPGPGPYAEHLRGAGQRVEFVELGPVRSKRIEGIRLTSDLLTYGPGLLRAVRQMAAVVKDTGADVLYTNSLKAHVYGAPVARLARVRHVLHVRDILTLPYLPLRLRNALWAYFRLLPPKRVIANSTATARVAPLRGPIDVIPSGLQREPRAQERPGGPPTIALLGRLERWKGQDVAIRALARVRRRFPDARLLLGGTAEGGERAYRDELVELAGVLGLADSVEFTGFVSDPLAFFARSDVALHASVLPEPFGQVVVEALAAGRPVVATAAGGPVEILLRGRAGLLVPPGDVDATADAIERLLDDADLYGTLAQAGLLRASDYMIERSAETTLRVLEEAAA